MFCNKCGTQISDDSQFCPACGQQVDKIEEQPASQPFEQPIAPQYTAPVYQVPVYQAPPAVNESPEASSILTMGILAIVFSCTFFASFLGIIFGAIGRSKVNNLLASGYTFFGKAKVGSILSKAGLIVGIVLTVIFVIYIFTIIGLIANS